MQRGFKTKAESLACDLRAELGLPPFAPLSGKRLVSHLKVCLIHPAEIPDMPVDLLHRVLNGGSEHWSAITFYDCTARPFIIHNPNHAPPRQESDLMHESAHILCKHPPAKIVSLGGFAMRTYNSNHEDEAAWLGGCLQIPRVGLLWAIKRNMSDEELAQHFGASLEMARFRRRTTGVDSQLLHAKSYRRRR